MSCKARVKFLSHGKHNNIHCNVTIGGTKRRPLFFVKIVVFFDTTNAYILHCNLHPDYVDLIDTNTLTKVIQDGLDRYDYTLIINNRDDYRRKRLKTEVILKQLKNG